MEINEFCNRFAEEVFDDTEGIQLTPDTYFKELAEYSSLTALAVIAFADENFDVEISGKEIRGVDTMQELFDLITSK